MKKSIHWGEIKIDSHLTITGRGNVAVVEFNTDLFKMPPFSKGDTFNYNNELCQITGVECWCDLLRGWAKSPVGLIYKVIENENKFTN